MTMQATVDRILDRIRSGMDVRLIGAPAPLFLTELAHRLEPSCSVLRVTAPSGGLGLSSLIAQLSGRDSFDEHDDAALELCFRRLAEPDRPDQRTVLLLDAAHGVQRPVLRYLQQAGRAAANLVLLIAFCPDLDALLGEPGMAPLRTRLTDATIALSGVAPIVAPPPSPALPTSAPALALASASRAPASVPAVPALPAPVVIPAEWTVGAPVAMIRPRARRRSLLWIASGMGMVASMALGVWLGRPGEHRTASPLADASQVASPTMAFGTIQPRAELTIPLVEAIRPAVIAATVPSLDIRPTPKPPDSHAAPAAPAATTASVPVTSAEPEPPVASAPASPQAPASPSPAVAKSVEAPAGDAPSLVAPSLAAPSLPTPSLAASSLAAPPLVAPPLVAQARRGPAMRAHWQAVARARPRMERAMEHARADDGDRAALAGAVKPEVDAPTRLAGLREPAAAPGDVSRRDTYRPLGNAGWLASRYVPPAAGPFIGTFSTGPDGGRVFRYGR